MVVCRKILLAVVLFAIPVLATHVAVLETVGDGDVLKRTDRLYLTDRLREVAVKTLPAYMGYTIMTRENINEMLPPGKMIEECEGSCLVETGKNISADYVAQAHVSKFGSKLTITVELYETAKGKLLDSFTGRSSDAEGLLENVEKNAVSLFSKINAQNIGIGGNEGFSGIKEGESFSMGANRQYIVRVNSQPEGAMLSVDGRPKCKSTPCNVQIIGGSHNFSFALDLYFDRDTSVDVQSNEQQISIAMQPNFGVLNLTPKLGAYGNVDELKVSVDDKVKKVGNLRLSAGKHHVEIKHVCYEPMSFDVSVKNGSELFFDRAMQPAMGGISLSAEGKNGPEVLPVFVDGKQVGKTPYQESVPICAKVEIGNSKDSVSVKLKYHETIAFVYKVFPDNMLRDKDGNIYKTVKIGEQVWMAENLRIKTDDSWCYENKESNCKKYGRLYSWSAAMKACPAGWHLPSKGSFETLSKSVGGEYIAGMKLRSKEGWDENGNGMDAYAFSALPAGYVYGHEYGRETFQGEGDIADFWSSTEDSKSHAFVMPLSRNYNNSTLVSESKNTGRSVRCLKNISVVDNIARNVARNVKYGKGLKDSDGNVYRTVKIGN